jgi:hypothetical protein
MEAVMDSALEGHAPQIKSSETPSKIVYIEQSEIIKWKTIGMKWFNTVSPDEVEAALQRIADNNKFTAAQRSPLTESIGYLEEHQPEDCQCDNCSDVDQMLRDSVDKRPSDDENLF